MIRLIVVDDHPIFTLALQALFASGDDGITVVAVAASSNGLQQALEQHSCDLVLLDMSMPDADGSEICRHLRQSHPEIKVLCLTMHKTRHHVRKMIEAGVHGYVLKSAEKRELVYAVQTVADGGRYFSPEIAMVMMGAAVAHNANTSTDEQEKRINTAYLLSRREIEIVRLIAEEMTTQEIAEKLFISPRTVESHRKTIMEKIGARNTAGIVKFAIEHESVLSQLSSIK